MSATGNASKLLPANLLLALDSVLGAMLDHAIAVTDADRGIFLEADSAGSLFARMARRSGRQHLSPESFAPSQMVLRQVLESRSSVITENLDDAGLEQQPVHGVFMQRVRSVVAIPLYAMHPAGSTESGAQVDSKDFLGIIYLDSSRPATFSNLEREVLNALGGEAASILDTARWVERERQHLRLDQEISFARDVQQAFLPSGFFDFPHVSIMGTSSPCRPVGGDSFDVFPLSEDRTAFLIADVSGKGLGAALLTTMLQGALSGMRMGADPARVFNHINNFLCARAELGMYATIFFGILDRDGHLEFINAGHPSPILLRTGEIAEPFSEGSYPVGLVAGTQYASASVKLQPHDTLVLFSDGITEAMDPDENLFGVPRLRDILDGQHESALDGLQKTILASVDDFARGVKQADDITLLLVRYLPTAPGAMSQT
jgi:sigma-B regulation protein RsbU (phosphoserine phosphatase)